MSYKSDVKLSFDVQYSLRDKDDGERLAEFLTDTHRSASTYLKGLVKADLDSKGFMTEVGGDSGQ